MSKKGAKKSKVDFPKEPKVPDEGSAASLFHDYQEAREKWLLSIREVYRGIPFAELSDATIIRILQATHVITYGPRFMLEYRLCRVWRGKPNTIPYTDEYVIGESFKEPNFMNLEWSDNQHLLPLCSVPFELIARKLDFKIIFRLLRTCKMMFYHVRRTLFVFAKKILGPMGTPLALSFYLYLRWIEENSRGVNMLHIRKSLGISKSIELKAWLYKHGYIDHVRNHEFTHVGKEIAHRLDQEYFVRFKCKDIERVNNWLRSQGRYGFCLAYQNKKSYRLANPYLIQDDNRITWKFPKFYAKHASSLSLPELMEKFIKDHPSEYVLLALLFQGNEALELARFNDDFGKSYGRILLYLLDTGKPCPPGLVLKDIIPQVRGLKYPFVFIHDVESGLCYVREGSLYWTHLQDVQAAIPDFHILHNTRLSDTRYCEGVLK